MPIKVPNELPVKGSLLKENIVFLDENEIGDQKVRPLRIVILNLMPLKEKTEKQLLRLLGSTPLKIEVIFLRTSSYKAKNISAEHMEVFYKTFEEVKGAAFDGLIVTGAPVENLSFESVDYWEELTSIFEWSNTNIKSALYICWGAQAALYYYYGIQKHLLSEKLFGIFEHQLVKPEHILLKGFDDFFFVPHSRHTEIRKEDIQLNKSLEILAESDEAGIYLAASKDKKQVFAFGHSEYERETLFEEFNRDKERGLNTKKPKNYFPGDDEDRLPCLTWRAHSNLLFSNWLHYLVL